MIPLGESFGDLTMSVHDTSFAVYFSDHDAVIECEALDPEYRPPESGQRGRMPALGTHP